MMAKTTYEIILYGVLASTFLSASCNPSHVAGGRYIHGREDDIERIEVSSIGWDALPFVDQDERMVLGHTRADWCVITDSQLIDSVRGRLSTLIFMDHAATIDARTVAVLFRSNGRCDTLGFALPPVARYNGRPCVFDLTLLRVLTTCLPIEHRMVFEDMVRFKKLE